MKHYDNRPHQPLTNELAVQASAPPEPFVPARAAVALSCMSG